MIADIMRLTAMYVVVRIFIELTLPSSRIIVKYLFWTAIALTVIGVVGPRANQFLDDIHNASVTYTKVKDGVDTVTKWPEIKESIPFVGTGPIKQKP